MKSFLLAVVLLFAAACSVTLAKDLWSQYVPPAGLVLTPGTYEASWTIPGPEEPFGQIGVAEMAFIQGVSSKLIADRPHFVSRKPVYGAVCRLSGSSSSFENVMFIALDESKGTGKGYDTLYADSNLDHRLADEKPVRTLPDPRHMYGLRFISVVSIPVKAMCPLSDNPNSFVVDIRPDLYDDGKLAGNVTLRGLWRGAVDSNRGKIPFYMWDGDRDFSFGKERNLTGSHLDSPYFEMGDAVSFAWGTLPGARADDWQPNRVRKYITASPVSISGRLYTFEPSVLGDTLTIKTCGVRGGRMTVSRTKIGACPILAEHSVIWSNSGAYRTGPGYDSILVPAGEYHVETTITVKGKDGLATYFTFLLRRPVAVENGGESIVNAGGKAGLYLAKDPTGRIWQRGQMVHVWPGYMMSDDWYGAYAEYPSFKDAPSIVFRDSAGKVVSTGRMKQMPHQMVVPKRWKPGNYTVEVTGYDAVLGETLRCKRPIEVK